jgi:hypothetical protein
VISSTTWVCVVSPEVEGHDAVGHLEHVVHVVGDEHDADALVGEPAHQIENLSGLRHTERGGGLVEHHHLALPQHGLGDGHGLALPAGEAGNPLADARHRAHVQPVERLPGKDLHLHLVQTEPVGALAPEEHVLDDVEVVAQRKVLVHDLDAEGGRLAGAVDGDRVAVEADLAGIGAVDAGQALHQCRLARPVVPDQCGHLTPVDVEIDIVQHVHGTEALVDAPHGEQRGHGRQVAHVS